MYECVEDALEVVDQITEKPAVAGDAADIAAGVLTDAHKYTRTLIHDDYPVLVEIDNQFFHSNHPAASIEELTATIQQFAAEIEYPADKTNNMNQVLNSINALAHSATAGVETGETNIHVPDLLLRTWNMACDLAEKRNDPTLKPQILDCLENNISDSGGCMPGIVARLYPPYARMIKYSLERILLIANSSPPTLQYTLSM